MRFHSNHGAVPVVVSALFLAACSSTAPTTTATPAPAPAVHEKHWAYASTAETAEPAEWGSPARRRGLRHRQAPVAHRPRDAGAVSGRGEGPPEPRLQVRDDDAASREQRPHRAGRRRQGEHGRDRRRGLDARPAPFPRALRAQSRRPPLPDGDAPRPCRPGRQARPRRRRLPRAGRQQPGVRAAALGSPEGKGRSQGRRVRDRRPREAPARRTGRTSRTTARSRRRPARKGSAGTSSGRPTA